MTDFPPLVIDYHGSRLAGVDEVGRGPLVGAVVAAAVILDPARPIEGLADSKTLSEKRRLALADAIREALSQVGLALGITSLVLFTGFALFTTSGFLLTVHFGALTAIVIAAALLADFLLLPPLLLWLDRR